MPSTLSEPGQMRAKSWLYDIFAATGIYNGPPKRASNYAYAEQYNKTTNPENLNAAETIAKAIVNRDFSIASLKAIDAALNVLSGLKFALDLPTDSSTPEPPSVRKRPETLASYVAYFCDTNNLFWDDSMMSAEERNEAKETTIIGEALSAAEVLSSQGVKKAAKSDSATADNANTDADNGTEQDQSQTNTASTSTSQPDSTTSNSQTTTASQGSTAATTAASTKAPANNYKATGPQSKNIPNLLNPDKQILTVPEVYTIVADKVRSNQPKAYITPLYANGNGIGKATENAAKNVKMGSGNGYTDCQLWFTDPTIADSVCLECQNKFGNTYSNIHVEKSTKPDKNGYFYVATEFGPAYIKATKLNEELLEQVSEELNKKATQGAYKIKDIDVYEEAFRAYE